VLGEGHKAEGITVRKTERERWCPFILWLVEGTYGQAQNQQDLFELFVLLCGRKRLWRQSNVKQ